MNLATLLTALELALSPSIVAAGGKMIVADHELDALNFLNLDTDRFNVILCASGGEGDEEARDQGGYVQESLSVFLQMPKPGTVTASKGLHKAEGTRSTPFLSRLAWVIAKFRGVSMDSSEIDTEAARACRFMDWDWVRVDGMPALVRCARIRFRVHGILDAPDTATSATLTTLDGVRVTLSGDDYLVVHIPGGSDKKVRLLNA